MCGLSGFTGITSAKARVDMIDALGVGIDDRGGHAAGYVSLVGNVYRMAKRVGTWLDSATRFRYTASLGETVMMHSRFATCGSRTVEDAHPWAIRRNGRTVLYGCHNGVLQGTYMSASRNKREHTVDSKELLELIADNAWAEVKELTGYGVVMWMTPGSRAINLLRLSSQSDIACVALTTGGIAWASTKEILSDALRCAGLESAGVYTLPDIGTVYQLFPDKVIATDITGMRVSSSWGFGSSYPYSSSYDTYTEDADEWDTYRAELAEEEKLLETALAKADESQWDNMTSAEWERWGRWVGKRPPDALPAKPAPPPTSAWLDSYICPKESPGEGFYWSRAPNGTWYRKPQPYVPRHGNSLRPDHVASDLSAWARASSNTIPETEKTNSLIDSLLNQKVGT